MLRLRRKRTKMGIGKSGFVCVYSMFRDSQRNRSARDADQISDDGRVEARALEKDTRGWKRSGKRDV